MSTLREKSIQHLWLKVVNSLPISKHSGPYDRQILKKKNSTGFLTSEALVGTQPDEHWLPKTLLKKNHITWKFYPRVKYKSMKPS